MTTATSQAHARPCTTTSRNPILLNRMDYTGRIAIKL
jgi:hypothetical protein